MHRALFTIAVFALLAGAATGCAVLAPGTGSSGGTATLGDAVAAATADTTTKVRNMDVGYQTPPDVSASIMISEPEPSTPTAESSSVPAGPPRPRPASYGDHPLFGLVGGMGFLGGGDYDRTEQFGITGGNFGARNWRWDVLAFGTDVAFDGESRLGRAFKNALDVELDVTGRYYITDPHTFMGAYALAGLGTGTMFWNYAQRIPVVKDGQATTVGDDHINHFDFFTGAGMSILQVRHLHVGGNLVGGVRIYGWHTYNGFENDELPTTGFARVLLEFEFRK